jgi:hypothetical protein
MFPALVFFSAFPDLWQTSILDIIHLHSPALLQ